MRQLITHKAGIGVELLGTVQCDCCDSVLDFDLDVFVLHDFPLYCLGLVGL